MIDWTKIWKVADAVANTDRGYTTNKRRTMVVAYEGFSLADFLRDNRFSIHVGAIVGSVLFAGIGFFRRKHGAESWTLWGTLSVSCACVAWYTRESDAVVDNGDGTYSEEMTVVEKAKEWLDDKAEELDRTDPGWAERTEKRVMGSL